MRIWCEVLPSPKVATQPGANPGFPSNAVAPSYRDHGDDPGQILTHL